MAHVLLVHQTHDSQIRLRLWLWLVVNPAALETGQATLFAHSELLVIKVNPRPRLTNRLRRLFF
jgi:hypothetical protein